MNRLNRGFTLIELTLVIALIALLTGIAVVSLAQPYQEARFESVVHQFRHFDEQTMERSCVDAERGGSPNMRCAASTTANACSIPAGDGSRASSRSIRAEIRRRR